ncbi:aminodeoxychorismate synthase component I [Pleionea sp. CnH1-48]|uniref:aminodeoxychorismate synthase component I n=1 Tax=Pleionea sp. CnH1-48 TaxID=2954494 RepID=UPI002096C4D7|nr:aminodeoxychorismate synthase component I [Pleionea sp. CnH1-48]MCO7223596.1 aminodeoxychorismate synthase component I [Pleionea sp. CnH1-48]
MTTTPTHINLEYLGSDSRFFYFEKVVDQAFALLLDSGGNFTADAQPLAKNNRYDIILVEPAEVLVSQDNEHKIIDCQSKKETIIDDCFAQMSRWQKHYVDTNNLNTFADSLPFNGGLAGAFAYDMGRQLEQLPQQAANELPIADCVVGLYLSALIIDHQKQTVTLYNFAESAENFERIVQYFCGTRPHCFEFQLTSDWQSNMSADDYFERFHQVKNYIKSGDCYQVNLAQRFSASFTGSAWAAYRHLSDKNKAPFSAFMNIPDGQILSLSPERFLQIAGRQVLTQPIKGTRPRSDDPNIDKALAEELASSEKDMAENVMIVDLLRNDLGRTATPGSVKVTELFGLYSFPSVHHLISTVVSEIDETTSAAEVLKESFPGGSITGAPKIRAMEIIEELEPHRRHFYCGSVGYIDFQNNMDTSITIRTLICHNERIYTWAGGGLVDDSQQQLEYEETFAKLSRILPELNHPLCFNKE